MAYKRQWQRKVYSIYEEPEIMEILAQVDENRSKAVAILAKYWVETHPTKETTEDDNAKREPDC